MEITPIKPTKMRRGTGEEATFIGISGDCFVAYFPESLQPQFINWYWVASGCWQEAKV